MGYIHHQNGHYSILPMDKPRESCDKMWFVIRSVKGRGYRLSEGDVIRIGRIKLKVREINTEKSSGPFSFENLNKEEDSDDCCLLYTSDAADE